MALAEKQNRPDPETEKYKNQCDSYQKQIKMLQSQCEKLRARMLPGKNGFFSFNSNVSISGPCTSLHYENFVVKMLFMNILNVIFTIGTDRLV